MGFLYMTAACTKIKFVIIIIIIIISMKFATGIKPHARKENEIWKLKRFRCSSFDPIYRIVK